MISVKDFATQQGCSEAIIYRHIRNHKEALGDRVQKAHGKTWITDEGADYLRGLMKQQPITIMEASDVEKELRKKLEDKQTKIELLQGFLLDAKDEIKALTDEKYALEAQNRRIALLEADNEAAKGKIAETTKTAQKASQELLDARKQFEDEKHLMQQEIEQLRNRKWYQMIFKR